MSQQQDAPNFPSAAEAGDVSSQFSQTEGGAVASDPAAENAHDKKKAYNALHEDLRPEDAPKGHQQGGASARNIATMSAHTVAKNDLPPRTNDFSALLHLANTSQILFRVTDPTSISPLYWTGRPSTSGFSSPNHNLAYLDPKAYHTIFTSPKPSSLAVALAVDEPYLRHTVLDHVMAKEKQTCLPTLTSIDERPDTPEDEKTPWISTSVDLDWVVYEVVRRLVFLNRGSVWVTVIAYPGRSGTSGASAAGGADGAGGASAAGGADGAGGASAAGGRVETAGMEGQEGQEEVRSPEVIINPALVLRMPHAKAKDLMLSVGMKENYDLARSASETSSERLIWGRVFASSILDHYEFTLDHSPLPLPNRFYRSSKQDGKGWTDGLVWDPRVDAYDTARRLMLERQRQIDAGRCRKLALSLTENELKAQPDRP